METKEIILELRTKRGLSQNELAERVHVTRQAVSRWENGETEEKIHQIRLYSGEKYELTDAAKAGTVCAVTGLTAAHSGDALGAEKGKSAALLEPVFTYRVHAEKAVTGSTDLFTKQEFDPWRDDLEAAFDAAGLVWHLNSAQYEEETGFWHYEWDWEVFA